MFEIHDPVLVFAVLMITFLLAPLVAEKLKLPELVLLLLAGVFFGPNGFGLMHREGGIELFGTIGLIYIMFVAGLETDTHHFRRMANRSAYFGLISFALPQGIGTLVSHYVLGFSWLTSILLASMFASHTLIAYPISSRLGISKNESVMVTVGGTIPTNTLALLVLAVVADYSKGVALGFEFWCSLVVGMAILTLVICWLLPIVAVRFFRNVPEKGGAQFVFVLGMVCLCSYWSHYAKMEPIIGAFLTGVAFNRLIPAQSTLMNRLVFVGNTLFIPFFLISVGMLINPRALLASHHGLFVAFMMSFTVIATKFLASDCVSRTFGYTKPERNVMFGLSVAQAAATLAAVLVGYDLKIFDDSVLNGTIVMILVTCSLGCYMVDRYGRAVSAVKTRVDPAQREQRIMVAVSNPETSSKLLDLSFLLRIPGMKGTIFPVTVIDDSAENASEAIGRGEKMLAECVSQAASVEIPLSPGLRLDSNPSDGLARAAKESRCGLLIGGWTGRATLKSRLFGNLPEKLLNNCPARLLFCRISVPLNTCRRIILPLPELGQRRPDFQDLIRDCKQLADQLGAELRVYIPPDIPDEVEAVIAKINPQCRVEFQRIEGWGMYENRFIESLAPLDLMMLPLDRRESVLWRPRFEGLSQLALEQVPTLNLLAAYPQLPESDENMIPVVDPRELETIGATRMRGVDLSETDVTCAVREMIEIGFLDSAAQDSIEVGLQESLIHHPFELSENSILIHTRIEDVKDCEIVVGRSQTPFRLDALNGHYNVIVALVSPKNGGQDQHLLELANLARHFTKTDFAVAVRNAKSASEILRLLRD